MAALLSLVVLWFVSGSADSATIELLECDPPDRPQWGGYGPHQDFYLPGDVIHYYCDAESYIGGNFYRRCEDTGDWSGDTPVCDNSVTFSPVRQTTTDEPADDNEAELATDNLRTTCTSTLPREGQEWSGTLDYPGEMIRVMLFMPKGNVAYEVLAQKANGSELSCGTKQAVLDRYGWEFHNCPGPNNRDVVGLKIRSLTTAPLQICEIAAHVLTSPTCTDPHLRVENGYFVLNRKVASLMCHKRYTKSPNTRVECVRDGQWNRKTLYCMERQWELDGNEPGESSEREPQINENERNRRPQTSTNERNRGPQTSTNERNPEREQRNSNSRQRNV